jgi:hypothetical protein
MSEAGGNVWETPPPPGRTLTREGNKPFLVIKQDDLIVARPGVETTRAGSVEGPTRPFAWGEYTTHRRDLSLLTLY